MGIFLLKKKDLKINSTVITTVVVIVVAIGVVIVVVAAVIVLAVGGGVATIIVGINCLLFCFVVFNLTIVSGEENLFYFIYF